MSTALPSPRDLLTSLIANLSSIPLLTNDVQQYQQNSQRRGTTTSSSTTVTNPLKLIPPAYRPLLTTLHVLYPSTLLPALDLLDRRLVARVVLKQDEHGHHQHTLDERQVQAPVSGLGEDQQIGIAEEDGDHNHNHGHEENTRGEDKNHNPIPTPTPTQTPQVLYHLVRSAQPQSNRRGHHHSSSGQGQMHVVRLGSWNCTCAAFAFSAFPPLPSSSSSSSSSFSHIFPLSAPSSSSQSLTISTSLDNGDQTIVTEEDKEEAWEFGGLSIDGRGGGGGGPGSEGGDGGVPCCKHLLACVLAEKWNTVLGGYMEERVVGREEAAGLVGDL